MAKKLKISVSQTQTIREAFDDFLLQKKALGLADKTIETYSHHFGIISKYLDSSAPIAGLFKRPLDEMIERMRSAGMKHRTNIFFTSSIHLSHFIQICFEIFHNVIRIKNLHPFAEAQEPAEKLFADFYLRIDGEVLIINH